MKLTNPFIGYLERSYAQIKSSLISKLKEATPEITDYSDNNILIVVLSFFAGLVEQLNFYIDNNARESFLGTARKFSSVVKLIKILDYRIKSYLPASVNLYITYVDNDENPVITTQEGTIPSGTVIRTINGVPFITDGNVTVEIGVSYGVLKAKQQERIIAQSLGLTTALANQTYDIPGQYAHNSMELTVDGVIWDLKDTLARSLPTDTHYIVDVNEDKIPYIRFGNGINGAIPPSNKAILGDYYVTEGSAGNTITPGTITELDGTLTLPNPATGILITNTLNPIAGSDVESIEDIRVNAPLTIRTLNRAVTIQDFKDIILQADGVAKANVVHNCGKVIDVYIAPNGGGLASEALLTDTGNYIETVKMVGTNPVMKAAGITPVVVVANVLARFRADRIQTAIDVNNKLGEEFSFDTQEINGRVAMSDIQALIDNLQRVDTVDIVALYTLPYPFPLNHSIPLDWERETLPASNQKIVWRLVYTGTDFRLYRNNAYIANVAINVVYTDPTSTIKFKINPGMYTTAQVWEFTSYAYNKTIKVDDNTIPVVIPNQTTQINVT